MIVKDMLQRETVIPKELRIISLVPSQTELLFDLDLENEVVGITNYCIHPEAWRLNKATIGGTKNINVEKIKSLNPTLIIANKEENSKETIELLEQECAVWVSDVYDFDSALKMIQQIALICNKIEKGNEIITNIKDNFNLIKVQQNKTAIYLIWSNPFMSVGGDTFINGMLEKVGFENLFKKSTRYPETSLEEIHAKNPEYILLSSEPYPFKEKHLNMFQKEFPNSKVEIVNGEMFSWYGSRMKKAAKYFQKIL